MKQIYLHIGHGKTGTSAFQALMAQSQKLLLSAGILYKEHPSFSNAIRSRISSGNIDPSDTNDWFDTQVLATVRNNQNYDKYVFSCENAFHYMDSVYAALDNSKDNFNLHVILAVRNPGDMLSSEYHQLVKRDGLFISYEAFLERTSYRCKHAFRALEIIEQLESKEISFSLLNFSNLGYAITRRISEIIGIDTLVDTHRFTTMRVNRSMSVSELQALVLVNRLYGKFAGTKLSDALVNSLPDIVSDPLLPSASSSKKIADEMKPIIHAINRRLPLSSPLVVTSDVEIESNLICPLDDSQVAIIKGAISELSQSEDRAWRAKRSSFLMKTANKILEKESLGVRVAFRLMKLAQHLQPSSQPIREKTRRLRRMIRR